MAANFWVGTCAETVYGLIGRPFNSCSLFGLPCLCIAYPGNCRIIFFSFQDDLSDEESSRGAAAAVCLSCLNHTDLLHTDLPCQAAEAKKALARVDA